MEQPLKILQKENLNIDAIIKELRTIKKTSGLFFAWLWNDVLANEKAAIVKTQIWHLEFCQTNYEAYITDVLYSDPNDRSKLKTKSCNKVRYSLHKHLIFDCEKINVKSVADEICSKTDFQLFCLEYQWMNTAFLDDLVFTMHTDGHRNVGKDYDASRSIITFGTYWHSKKDYQSNSTSVEFERLTILSEPFLSKCIRFLGKSIPNVEVNRIELNNGVKEDSPAKISIEYNANDFWDGLNDFDILSRLLFTQEEIFFCKELKIIWVKVITRYLQHREDYPRIESCRNYFFSLIELCEEYKKKSSIRQQ